MSERAARRHLDELTDEGQLERLGAGKRGDPFRWRLVSSRQPEISRCRNRNRAGEIRPRAGRGMSRRRVPGTRAPRTVLVFPTIPDDAPVWQKNALAVRNACATEGRCRGCGAVGELRRYQGEPAFVAHSSSSTSLGCPTLTDEVA